MNNRISTTIGLAAALAGVSLGISTASAQYSLNLSGSEYRTWENLPAYTEDASGELSFSAQPERVPWVGYWWAYGSNGIDWQYQNADGDRCSGSECQIAPAEKLDQLLGRDGAIDRVALEEYVAMVEGTLHEFQEERTDLVRDLNRAIANGENYRDCSQQDDAGEYLYADHGSHPYDAVCVGDDTVACECPWNRYWELDSLIKQAEEHLPELTIDTAVEFEHLNHGDGVPGVQGWWGHCNAWSAAAVLEPEPIRTVDQDGISFSVGDVKALLTEAYMDVASSFYGTRLNEDDFPSTDIRQEIAQLFAMGNTKASIYTHLKNTLPADQMPVKSAIEQYVDYLTVSPTDFHLLFSVYIGKLGRSFVVDRYTGTQVWNQPVTRYETTLEDAAMEPEYWCREGAMTVLCEEGDVGATARYPVRIRTFFEWATDGVYPNATNASEGANAFHGRSLVYVLYLDKALAEAGNHTIVGNGKWVGGAGDSAHPDFIWAPNGDSPPTPRQDGSYYENPYVGNHMDALHELLQVASTPAEPEPEVPSVLLDAVGHVDRHQELAYEPIVVPAGYALRVVMSQVEGDPDLYVRLGEAPTTKLYDCRPYKGRGREEFCPAEGSFPVSTVDQIYYVMVRGFSEAGYQVIASVERPE